MPREEYQVPSGASAPRGATGHDAAPTSTMSMSRAAITYICGDCGGAVTLNKDSLVACPHCSGRVLFKERTKRMVQFEAR